MRLSRGLLAATPERQREIHQAVVQLSAASGTYYLMVVLSTTIAAFGLLANSTAVVIGAMLVAPLMGPIFGIALGLTAGDRGLLARAALAEVIGAALVVGLAAVLGMITIRPEFGSEITGRTQPTLYDIVVAVASGLAGAYAMVNARVSPALPGVAIATALVPPLATCGLCLSAGRLQWALGAFLLFFANLLAIELAAALVFAAAGMAEAEEERGKGALRHARHFGVSLVLLTAMGAYMTHTLLKIVAERRLERTLWAELSAEMRATMGAELTELRHRRHSTGLEVTAVVLTPQEFAPEQVGTIEDTLRQRVGPGLRLVVRSLLSRDSDRRGPVFVTHEERRRRAQAWDDAAFLSRASRALREGLQSVPGASLVDVRRGSTGGALSVTAVVRSPVPIEPAQVAHLQDALQGAEGTPVRLTVRSVLTRDADADRYVYEKEEEKPKPLTGLALRFHRRLKRALGNQAKLQVQGATLKEFRYRRRHGRLLVLAVVRTPATFAPTQVDAMQTTLRRFVHPGIELIVRSQTGGETSAASYLSGFDESKLGE